jgi:putative transposase
MLNSISAVVIFRGHPEVKKDIWGGEFWEDGYFVRTVGYKVTVKVISKYIGYPRHREVAPQQIELV